MRDLFTPYSDILKYREDQARGPDGRWIQEGGDHIKATAHDIKFARQVASQLRSSLTPHKRGDLYWSSSNRASRFQAQLYERAANYMERTGRWHMPSHEDLKRAQSRAWRSVEKPFSRPRASWTSDYVSTV